MINHIVLFRFKPNIKAEEIQLVFNSIETLAQKFAGVKNFSWGPNTNEEGLAHGYDYALFLQFQSEDTRKAYQNDPYNHKISKEIVIPMLCPKKNPALVFDFNTNTLGFNKN